MLGSPATGEESPSLRTRVCVPGHGRAQGGVSSLYTLDCKEEGVGEVPTLGQVSAQAARAAVRTSGQQRAESANSIH